MLIKFVITILIYYMEPILTIRNFLALGLVVELGRGWWGICSDIPAIESVDIDININTSSYSIKSSIWSLKARIFIILHHWLIYTILPQISSKKSIIFVKKKILRSQLFIKTKIVYIPKKKTSLIFSWNLVYSTFKPLKFYFV